MVKRYQNEASFPGTFHISAQMLTVQNENAYTFRSSFFGTNRQVNERHFLKQKVLKFLSALKEEKTSFFLYCTSN